MANEVIIVSVTTKGREVIPISMRRTHEINEGTRIVVLDACDEIILKPITAQRIRRLRGSLKGAGALDMLIAERQKDKLCE